MNKKEQAAFDELKKQVLIARALRFTDDVQPDVPIPSGVYGDDNLAKGWLQNPYIGGPRVAVACSSSVSHSFGDDQKTNSQGARRLFSTKLLALRAMRHQLELQCAKILAGVDLQIEEERAKDGAP